MGRPPATSPVTGKPVPDYYVHSDSSNGHFRDIHGRSLLLRGVNLASSAKTPHNQPTWKLEGFWEGGESGEMSFVNRTLNLDGDEADVHLTKLKAWGFNCFRYVFTWEAIEHGGPGKYDDEFVQYTIRMLEKIKSYGFRVFMDPHQDLFSRFAGGDGAPYWVIQAAGMNARNFTATNATVLHCEWPSPDNPDPENFPDMIWASSYQRLANMTLQTMFWAGKDYAPKCIIDGVNIQEWMQSHYLNAVKYLAEKIAAHDNGALLDTCVIGWDSLNEPNGGAVGILDVANHSTAQNVLRIGPSPTALEAFRLGMGEAVDVDEWKFSSTGPKKVGRITIDPKGKSVWLSQEQDAENARKYGWKRGQSWPVGTCIWATHGVWDVSTKKVLNGGYFRNQPGVDTPADFGDIYWKPHFERFGTMIRSIHHEAILFAHSPVFETPPDMKDVEIIKNRAVFSTHFYDGVTLVTKHWNWFNYDILGVLRGKYWFLWQGARLGETAIRKMLQNQITILREDGFKALGNYPTMVSEIGQPFDLDNRASYKTGDYTDQIKALDALGNACDGINAANFTTWCYSASNTYRYGEDWNGEDLSLFCMDEVSRSDRRRATAISANSSTTLLNEGRQTPPGTDSLSDINAGARAIQAFCRPFPVATVGTIKKIHFEIASSLFKFEVMVGPGDVSDKNAATEIYIPSVHYGESEFSGDSNIELDITVSHGRTELRGTTLYWYYDEPAGQNSVEYRLEVRRAGGPKTSAEIAKRSSATAWLLRPIYILQEQCVVS